MDGRIEQVESKQVTPHAHPLMGESSPCDGSEVTRTRRLLPVVLEVDERSHRLCTLQLDTMHQS